MPSPSYLGVDAGGSSTRWLLINEAGEELVRGVGRPLSANQLRTDERSAALTNLTDLLTQVAAAGAPARVVAGVAALEPGSLGEELLTSTIAEALALPLEAVRVMPDIHTAYLASLRPSEGVLVYAGTGSIGFHLGADGSELRAGGHGFMIDDAGGGYWIGREALKRVLRNSDELGAPASGLLANSVYSALGGNSWDTIRSAVYGGGRAKVASLTRVVSVAAAKGDSEARGILAEAGAELARLARVVSRRLGVVLPVVLAGGVARCGAPLTESLASALPVGASFSVNESEPVEAAAELARNFD